MKLHTCLLPHYKESRVVYNFRFQLILHNNFHVNKTGIIFTNCERLQIKKKQIKHKILKHVASDKAYALQQTRKISSQRLPTQYATQTHINNTFCHHLLIMAFISIEPRENEFYRIYKIAKQIFCIHKGVDFVIYSGRIGSLQLTSLFIWSKSFP